MEWILILIFSGLKKIDVEQINVKSKKECVRIGNQIINEQNTNDKFMTVGSLIVRYSCIKAKK